MKVAARAKKWGNSLGIIIPKSIVEALGIREEEEIVMNIETSGRSNVLKESFGMGTKEKKSTQEWKDEFRKSLY